MSVYRAVRSSSAAVRAAVVAGVGNRSAAAAHWVVPACWSAFNKGSQRLNGGIETRAGWGNRFASTNSSDGSVPPTEDGPADAEAATDVEQDTMDRAEVASLEDAVAAAEMQFYADIRAAKRPIEWKGRPSDAVGACALLFIALSCPVAGVVVVMRWHSMECSAIALVG